MSDSNGNGRLRGRWQAYTLDTGHDRVQTLFEARHGYPPAEVLRSGPILLAGPIGENGHDRPACLRVRASRASLLARVQACHESPATPATRAPPRVLAVVLSQWRPRRR